MSDDREDAEDQLTPDLPPPVEAPELWRDAEERTDKKRPPDPEHGPGSGTGTGEPPD